MGNKQFKMLMDELGEIRNLLILIASKNKANSVEISKVLNTSDSRVRQILTATGGWKKRESSKAGQEKN